MLDFDNSLDNNYITSFFKNVEKLQNINNWKWDYSYWSVKFQ